MDVLEELRFPGDSFFFKELAAIAFDEPHARVLGLPAKSVDLVFLGLLIATVVAGMQVAGIVLVVSMMITPAAAARGFRGSLATITAIAAIIGAGSAACGVLLSLEFEAFPTGSAMTLSATAAFIASLLLPMRRRRGAAA